MTKISGRYSVHILSAILAITLALVLNGCTVRTKGKIRSRDRAPTRHINYQHVPDAVPKLEKYHPYGTRDYVVKRRRYRVLKSTRGYVRRGYASWYGTSFHGRYTSTQDIYNLYAMTAASPELPLPCYAEVTNLANGKRVIVKVNDRGPFYGKRILDLSYAAARKLGFAEQGVAYVQVVALGEHNWDYERNTPKKYASFLPKVSSRRGTDGDLAGSGIDAKISDKVDRGGKKQVIVEDKGIDGLINKSPSKGIGQVVDNAMQGLPSKKTNYKDRTSSASMVTHPATLDCIKAPVGSRLSEKRVIRDARWLQIATFSGLQNAQRCEQKIRRLLPTQKVFIKHRSQQHMYSVRLGPVDKGELPVLLDRVRSAGFKPLVITQK